MPALRERKLQEDFSAGMNRDVAPALIPDNGAYDFANVLLDEDGNPYRRGGTSAISAAAFGASGLTWVWAGFLKPGRRTIFANSSDFGVLASNGKTVVNLDGAGLAAPKQWAVLADCLFIGGGYIYGGAQVGTEYSTGTVSVTHGSKTVTGASTFWSVAPDAGALFQRSSSERVYVVASVDSDTQITLRDNYEGETKAGSNYTLNAVAAPGTAGPYEEAQALTVCSNRLVTINGRRIRFSEINNPHKYTNSLGTANEHTLPAGVEGVGAATVGQTVLMFTTAGIWTLDGLALDITDANGNPQHRIQQLSADIVLAGPAGISSSGQRVIVPATDAIYLMDGVSAPVPISRPIERLYQQYVADGYILGGATTFRGHYFLPIIRGGNGEVRDCLVCRLDRPVRSKGGTGFPWSRFAGDGGEISTFAVRTEANAAKPELIGAQARSASRVVDCSDYFSPGEGKETDADDTVPQASITTRDIETGGQTENSVRSVKLRYELLPGRLEGAAVQVSWGGPSVQEGTPLWDEITWDEFEWAGGEGTATFRPVAQTGAQNDGSEVVAFPVNKRLRYGRFKVETRGEPANFALRSLEMDVRPSKAVRR